MYKRQLEGERRYSERESYADYGYQEQEIKDNEFVSVESSNDDAEEPDSYLEDAADGEDE